MTENLPVSREYSPREIELIKNLFAKGCGEEEFGLFITLAKTYQLDPFKNQIWCVKYGSGPARVFTGRDGFLEIAHRSGQFDGMESGVKVELAESEGEGVSRILGWAKVHRKDMKFPFSVEVDMDEYRKETAAWKQMPRTMIQKVAESQALRKAFSASGLYAPEEFDETEKPPMKDVTPKEDKRPLSSTSPGSSSPESQGERDYIPTREPIIDADKAPKKKRQVKVGGKWVDEDKADLVGGNR